MEIILLICAVTLLVLNLIVLIGIGAFLVSLRDRINAIFSDIITLFAENSPPELSFTKEAERPKTWDEKYEEELEALQRRLRGDSGLLNLPDPGVSWGEPPAMNNANAQGLNIQNK